MATHPPLRLCHGYGMGSTSSYTADLKARTVGTFFLIKTDDVCTGEGKIEQTFLDSHQQNVDQKLSSNIIIANAASRKQPGSIDAEEKNIPLRQR